MRKRALALSVLLLLVALGGFVAIEWTSAQDDDEFTYAGEVAMPPFPEDVEWINVSEPITIEDLNGKIVILDFWTYGCINCIHIIPDLERLQEEYGDQLVIIGVHSAKFDNEGQTDNIRQIVRRYDRTEPVVNDSDFTIWDTYGVRAWPTLVLVEPRGTVVGAHAGEGVYEVFHPILETMVEEYGAAGLIDDTPLPMLQPEVDDLTPLSFPGKVLADPATNRLIISDTDHDRLIVANLDDPTQFFTIGSGQRGFEDGDFDTATFHNPHGVTLDGDVLYVADTGNHAIRRIDLAAQTVSTLVGTGEQAESYPPTGGTAPDVALSSPWDMVLHDDVLYIAMAGPHQLWRMDLVTGETVPHAGSGRESVIDGPLADAELAQPSGITTDGELLYFVDAESSAVRTADIATDGVVTTLIGTGLFDYGDVDGTGTVVRLQHALGVTVGPEGMLYVADTYNNKIKRIDPETRESVTFAGDGQPGLQDGPLLNAQFYEPGGIDYADGKLYVADTNNHAIRVIDLETETVSTISFGENETVLIPEGILLAPEGGDGVIVLPEQQVAAGKGTVTFDIQLPDGYKLNELAPFTIVNTNTDVVSIQAEFAEYRELVPELPVRLPANFFPGTTTYTADVTVYWCEAVNEDLCFIDRLTFEIPVTVTAEGDDLDLTLPYELVPPTFASDFSS
jgi:DNA-binding beta-propeller fold protein YncE